MIFDPYTPRTVGLFLRHFGFYTIHPKHFVIIFVFYAILYYFKEMHMLYIFYTLYVLNRTLLRAELFSWSS
jgi:hypothetical protein